MSSASGRRRAAALLALTVALVVVVAVFGGRVSAPPSGERCGGCHLDAPPGVHAAVACTACHQGDGAAAVLTSAHRGLEREPGALDTVNRTCGPCHPAEVATVRALPMTTGRGIVGVDRFVFGEIATPDTEQTLSDVLTERSPSPGEEHLRRLCAGCHLGTRRDDRDDAVTGASGCSACHSGATQGHSTVDADVPDSRCEGCHSRSTRIALTYAGFAESSCGVAARTLPDGRPLCTIEPDVHQRAGLRCVDCHVHTELMGDGISRPHQEDQVELRCESCHAPVGERWADVVDPVVQRVGRSRAPDDVVATASRGTALWNVVKSGETWTLFGKQDGRPHPVTVVADHAGPGHERLTCAACHAAIAPTCTECHTERTASGEQWDFGSGATAAGRWVETGAPGMAPPALGVGADGRIRPAIPGMIASLGAPVHREVRRFALVDPHATRRASRTCAGCHRSSQALGLGTGTLDAETFRFTPTRPVVGAPDLADDGWTTLLGPPGEGTRMGHRSLDPAELRRAVRVGACLSCHEPGATTVWSAAAAHTPLPSTCGARASSGFPETRPETARGRREPDDGAGRSRRNNRRESGGDPGRGAPEAWNTP